MLENKFEIIPSEPEDAQAISTLVNMAYRGETGKQGWTTETDLIDGTRTDAELIEQIIRKPDSLILKYLENNEIVGCVELRKEGEKFYLGMLTVKPNTQGKGIGKALMKASEEEGRKRKCKTMFMRVLSQRHELIAWYVRHGYTLTDKKEPFVFTDPRYGKPKMDLEFVILEKAL